MSDTLSNPGPAAGAAGAAGNFRNMKKSALPEWRVERWVAGVGRFPAGVGRWLDGVAAEGWGPARWVVRFFSSVWLGLLWLFLTGLYIAVGSGFADLRAWLEITDMQFFDAPPLIILTTLLAVTVTMVTLRRIPLTIYRVGVWTVHSGIIVLLVGSYLYFGQKREGSVRIFQGQTVSDYYDSTERAMYFRRVDEKDGKTPAGPEVMAPVKGLPIYYERLSKEAYPAGENNPLDVAVPMGGAADGALKDLSVRVVGYYPYADMNGEWTAGTFGVGEGNPAVLVERSDVGDADLTGGTGMRESEWLIGNSPAERVWDAPEAMMGVEYLYHPSAEKLEEITASFKGSGALLVRVPKLKVEKVYPVEMGNVIVVEGTPYTLTPGTVQQMPMLSKGYENATDSALVVDVTRKEEKGGAGDFHFERFAMARYPERSPDFVKTAEGKQKRVQDRVDHDIDITYLDAGHDQFWVVENEHGALALVHREAGGQTSVQEVKVGEAMEVKVRGERVTLRVAQRTGNAVRGPRIIERRFRQHGIGPTDAIGQSVVELALKKGEWEQRHIYVPFAQFASAEGPPYGEAPALVEVPGVGMVRIVYSTLRRALPVDVTLSGFQVVKRPGAVHAIEKWVSTVTFTDRGTGEKRVEDAWLNHPARDEGLVYFQAGWSGDENAKAEEQFTILGVGNRPGVPAMITGALMAFIGTLYSFYVKPLLLNAKKRQLAAFAGKEVRA